MDKKTVNSLYLLKENNIYAAYKIHLVLSSWWENYIAESKRNIGSSCANITTISMIQSMQNVWTETINLIATEQTF